MSEIGERLRQERNRIQMTQTDFGLKGGVKKNAQSNYESGIRAPDAVYLSGISDAGADIHYILTGERSTSALSAPRLQQPATGPSEFTEVPVYSAQLAAGCGSDNADAQVIAHMAFRRDWLRKIGVSPSSAVIARAKGDSMWPTVHDGDVVLVDVTQATPPSKPRDPADHRPATIYALMDEDGARLKRVVLASEGTLALLSDNLAVPPEFRPASSVRLIGKVMWWGHTNAD